MTDGPTTSLLLWPQAYLASGASAVLNRLNEDVMVTKLPPAAAQR